MVMLFWTDTFVTKTARNVMKENAMRSIPGRMLQICEGIEINDRGTQCRSNMYRTRVIGKQQGREREQRGQLCQREPIDQ
jgi:hypothetical protein